LRELLRAVEPVSLSERQRTSRATQLTSLTTLGDFAVPDAPRRHEMAALVTDALGADSTKREAARTALTAEFARWRELPARLAALADRAPLVHDADGVAADLAALGAAGDEALAYLANGSAAPADWADAKRALLDQAAKSKNLLRVAEVDALRTLITAAATGGSPRPEGP
jgi:hexosaminidase